MFSGADPGYTPWQEMIEKLLQWVPCKPVLAVSKNCRQRYSSFLLRMTSHEAMHLKIRRSLQQIPLLCNQEMDTVLQLNWPILTRSLEMTTSNST